MPGTNIEVDSFTVVDLPWAIHAPRPRSRLFEGTQGAPLLTSLPVLVWIYGGMNVIGDVEFYGPIEYLSQSIITTGSLESSRFQWVSCLGTCKIL